MSITLTDSIEDLHDYFLDQVKFYKAFEIIEIIIESYT